MSGHSKWSTIKRQKGVEDAKRSASFTKLSYAITIAARDGGGDPETNFKLRLAMDKARSANMPKDNIERAIKRGTGELGGAEFEHIVYEAYAQGGTAVLIEVNTDNRNRAVASIKSLLNKYNAKLAESGSVSYLFEQTGVMSVNGKLSEETEMAIIESGATDYEAGEDGTFSVYTDPKEVTTIAEALQKQGFTVKDVELSQESKAIIEIADPNIVESLIKFMADLEDLDDVSSVYTNFDTNLPMK